MAKCNQCGKNGLMLKLFNGLCSDCIQKAIDDYTECKQELSKLRDSITPDMYDAISLAKKIEDGEHALLELERQKKTTEREIAQLKIDLQNLNGKIIVANDIIELETFSLYEPKYSFVTSDEYKSKLDSIREAQKRMIKSQTAAVFPHDWAVDGSLSEGKKMVADSVKLFLRSFNNECDIAISAVKFSNFGRCRDRIEKSFATINQLGRVTRIRIDSKYKALKLDELALAYEYQCKKQDEKEQLRVLHEQQREEAKLAKEIEAARKEAEKERKHYQQALEKLKQQLAACNTEEEKAALIEKQNDIINSLDDISAKLEDIDYRQSNQRAGYVYVISNVGSFGEGVFKIGMTRRLDPMERIFELGDASVPFFFDVHAMIFSDDAPKLEAALHQSFSDRRVNMVNKRREYFRVSLEEIKKVVLANHDKTVEFIDVPEAQQYRESLLIADK